MSNSRSKSSRRWLDRQHSDRFTLAAKKLGYRSRSAFKLLEIQKRDQLIRKGMTVVDLGAAPGGWSQIAAELVGRGGKIIALDRLPMDSLNGVDILIGDFQEEAVFNELISKLEGKTADVIISDMAPNLSGMSAVDQPRSIYLAELALTLVQGVLKEGGEFLVKVFQGEGFDGYSAMLKEQFKQVIIRKPEASRSESREVYILAKGYISKAMRGYYLERYA